MRILACDAGSHSFKAALYDVEPSRASGADGLPPAGLWDGTISWNAAGDPALLRERWSNGPVRESSIVLDSFHHAPERLLRAAIAAPRSESGWDQGLSAIVHRVVHAGPLPTRTAFVDAALKQAMLQATQLAPGHNPTALATFEAAEKLFRADVPQVAVFDSCFHATMPEEASTYAVPRSWREVWNIRKVGFHGISHRYCAERAAAVIGRDLASVKTVTCHLGGGGSLAAVDGGRSIDTTMGWTTLDGLVMEERCGSIDPGIVIYLLRRNRYTADEISRELNERSGLLGLSGLSADMRDVIDGMARGLSAAKLAFDVYVHRLRAGIAAMAASLGGVDVLAFTGGVGENCAEVRAAACERLGFLDLAVDPKRNAEGSDDRDISPPDRRARVMVIKSEERWALALECARFLAAARSKTI